MKGNQKEDHLHYKTIRLPRLTRGIAGDATELVGNKPMPLDFNFAFAIFVLSYWKVRML